MADRQRNLFIHPGRLRGLVGIDHEDESLLDDGALDLLLEGRAGSNLGESVTVELLVPPDGVAAPGAFRLKVDRRVFAVTDLV